MTTNSKHSNHISKNILDRDFVAARPNEKWLTDITYIETKGKFVYLSAIIDLHSRRVLSWIVSRDMKTQLVVDTLKQALKIRIFHRFHFQFTVTILLPQTTLTVLNA